MSLGAVWIKKGSSEYTTIFLPGKYVSVSLSLFVATSQFIVVGAWEYRCTAHLKDL